MNRDDLKWFGFIVLGTMVVKLLPLLSYLSLVGKCESSFIQFSIRLDVEKCKMDLSQLNTTTLS